MISALCAVLERHEGIPVTIEERPDRPDPQKRGKGGCDAIIMRGGQRWAVEHTTIHGQVLKPFLIEQLQAARPVISQVVEAAFPHSIVRVGLPVDRTLSIKKIAAVVDEVAGACVEELRGARKGERVRFSVTGLPQDVFAERLFEPASKPLCTVNPAVWGRDVEEFTADDFCRAFVEKRKQALGRAEPFILLLDTCEYANLPAILDPFQRAVARESVEAYREIYVGTTQYDPPFIIPLKLGDRLAVGQPVLGQFIGHRFTADQ